MAHVRDVMTHEIITVPQHAIVDVAIDLMLEKNVSGIAIVDDHGHLVGILTEYDVLELYEHADTAPDPISPCSRYMTTNVRTIQANASLATAAKIFHAASLRRLMVLDGDQLVGILSRRDIVRHIRDRRLRAAMP